MCKGTLQRTPARGLDTGLSEPPPVPWCDICGGQIKEWQPYSAGIAVEVDATRGPQPR